MGEVPDWYPLIRAARYLRVAPWELLAQPVVWQQWATSAMHAENEAQRQKSNAPGAKGH